MYEYTWNWFGAIAKLACAGDNHIVGDGSE